MIIKINQDSLSIVKHSMNVFEKDYVELITMPTETEVTDYETIITIKGEKHDLYRVLYMISRECDIELM